MDISSLKKRYCVNSEFLLINWALQSSPILLCVYSTPKQLFWYPVLRMEKICVIIRSKFRPFASCVEIKGTNDCLCWISWNRSGVLQKRVQLVIWAVSKYLFRSLQCCCWCHFTAQDHLFVEGNDFNSRVDGFQCGGKGGGTCTIPTSGYWAALRRQSPFWSLYAGQQQQKVLNLLACMCIFDYKISVYDICYKTK